MIRVDVSDCTSSIEMVALAKSMITSDMKDDMVRIVLSGHVDIHTEKDIITIQKLLEDTCWYVEVKDETELSFDYGEYAKLLSEKKTYTEIAEETGASTATISRVNRCVNYGSGGYSTVLSRITKNK